MVAPISRHGQSVARRSFTSHEHPEPWSAARARSRLRTQSRRVKRQADLSRRRLTARSGEDRSTGRAGMDGVEPKPLLAVAVPFAATARDIHKIATPAGNDK